MSEVYFDIVMMEVIIDKYYNNDDKNMCSRYCDVIDKWKWSWWRHQMETFSALLAICAGNSPIPSEFPAQRPVTQSYDVFFDLGLNKRLSKQLWGWWFETPLCPLWRHCNVERMNKQTSAGTLYFYIMCDNFIFVILEGSIFEYFEREDD